MNHKKENEDFKLVNRHDADFKKSNVNLKIKARKVWKILFLKLQRLVHFKL